MNSLPWRNVYYANQDYVASIRAFILCTSYLCHFEALRHYPGLEAAISARVSVMQGYSR